MLNSSLLTSRNTSHLAAREGSSAAQSSIRGSLRAPCSSRVTRSNSILCRAAVSQEPLLLRTARGEVVERTPVWLMRQAGRYMAAFREFSDKYPFRMRSETADIAVELSLQPYKAFQTDGVIFFSDILTPLPAMGIEFDVIKGKGPLISNPVRSMEHVKALKVLDNPRNSLPFIEKILSTLRSEINGDATLIGFIGTPWTLSAYSVEGKSDKECRQTKMMMFSAPDVLHALLDHLTESLITYAGYQIESGAQILMLFDSWAHHLSPEQFAEFSMPYSERIVKALQAKYPHVPVIFHANGGTGKLDLIKHTAANVVGLDWATDMSVARETLGPNVIVQGNVDPMLLFAPENVIIEAVQKNLLQAGSRGHILNVGHGVPQGTPEHKVALFCEQARQSGNLFARQRELVGSK